MQERTKKRYLRYWKNFKAVKLYIFYRFLSVLGLSVVFSSIATALSLSGIILYSQKRLLFGLTAFCVCFLLLDISFMRKDYYRIAHRRKYCMVNCISHGLFAVINIAACKVFAHTQVYAFVFGITNALSFSHCNVNPVISAIVFNLLALVSIQFATIGMKWIHLHHG